MNSLQHAMQAAGVGLLTMDYVANTATPNEKAAEIWGLASLEPVALRSLYDHFHPDDLTEIERKIEESLDSRGSGAVDLDFRILRADGSIRWLRAGQHVCFDAQGPRSGVMVAVDVTRQKSAETAMTHSHAESQTHFEMAGIANAEIQLESGHIVRVNRRFCSLTGYTESELLNRKLQSLILVDDRIPCACDVEEFMPRGSEQHEAEKRFVRKDGSVGWIHLTATLIRGDADKNSSLLINAQDITGRKQIESRIQESESRFRTFMENSPTYAFMKDAEGRYVYVNPQCAKLIPLDKWIGKTDLDLFPSSTANEFRANDRNVLSTGQPEQSLETLETENGPIYFLAIKFPLQTLKGQVLLAGISVDVTAKYRAEQELRDADRRKNHFLATLAHELRNPLAPIRNAVQILQLKASLDPELVWVKEMLGRQVGQMSRLLDGLIDLSRISRNRLELRKSRIELSKILEIAIETSRPLIDAEQHHFTMSLPKENIYLDGDFVRLSQVFSNLLNNAAKYTPKGGRIHLSVVIENAEIVVTVSDSGIGIPPEKLGEIFEIFWQGSITDTSHSGGLGIGLSIVRGLVELHQGSVEACSAGVGAGSQFRVRLPYRRTETTAGVPNLVMAQTALHCTRQTVLVVDDNPDSADSMAMQLRLKGHQTLVSNDGERALEIIQSTRPDVILLDIGLPGISGHEVALQIRQFAWGKKVLLIAMTGWGQRADRIRSQQAGFDFHLTKPVDLTQLDQILTSTGSA